MNCWTQGWRGEFKHRNNIRISGYMKIRIHYYGNDADNRRCWHGDYCFSLLSLYSFFSLHFITGQWFKKRNKRTHSDLQTCSLYPNAPGRIEPSLISFHVIRREHGLFVVQQSSRVNRHTVRIVTQLSAYYYYVWGSSRVRVNTFFFSPHWKLSELACNVKYSKHVLKYSCVHFLCLHSFLYRKELEKERRRHF